MTPARKPPGYHDVLDDLGSPGCPVCRAAVRTARSRVASLLDEGVTDPGVRARWRAGPGFCQDHSLLLLQMARTDGQAVALLYQDLLRGVREEVTTTRHRWAMRWWQRLGPRLGQPRASCLVCDAASARADTHLAVLATVEPGDDVHHAARQPGRAPCVPHLRQGLAGARTRVAHERLLEWYLEADRALDAELTEYLRKLDVRFAGEPAGSEQTSWRRAFLRMVGLPHHAVDLDSPP